MWPWRFEPRDAARKAIEAARRAVGDRLLGGTLYGSAVTADFQPAHSDVNLALVLDTLGVSELEALRRASPEWARRRVTRPLLLAREELQRSRDTFALEYLLIRERHENLYGEDFFAPLAIEPAALRLGVERALRVQQLGLAASYVSLAGTRAGARYWAARASTALAASASGLLYLAGEPLPATRAALAARCADRFQIDAGTMTRLLLIRAPHPAPIEATELLASALTILNRLLDTADRMAAPPAPH